MDTRLTIITSANPKTLASMSKKALFDLLVSTTSSLAAADAIALCQRALNNTTTLGQRFWKQGLVNESGFARGTVRDIRLHLQGLLAELGRQSGSEQYVLEGHRYTKKKCPDKAISSFNKAIKHNPQDVNAHFHRGYAFFRYNNLDAAIADYTQAISLLPGTNQYHYDRGEVYLKKFMLNEALADANEAIILNKPYIEWHHYSLRGRIYYHQGKFNEALADFDQAINRFPILAQLDYIYSFRGNIYKAQGNIKAAVSDYTQAIKSNQRNQQVDEQTYDTLKTILTDASAEVLNRLPKNDVLQMILDILSSLKKERCY